MANVIRGLRDATPEKVSAFRARDVRVLLEGTNTHPKVVKALEALAESSHAHAMHNQAMANAINQMTDIVAAFAVVAENMKKVIDIPEDLVGKIV